MVFLHGYVRLAKYPFGCPGLPGQSGPGSNPCHLFVTHTVCQVKDFSHSFFQRQVVKPRVNVSYRHQISLYLRERMLAVVPYSEPYRYSQLNEKVSEVRLLTILPGTFYSEIRILFSVVPFPTDSNLSFEALSYTWGSSENWAKILVGHSGRRTITITRNLAEALPYHKFQREP
jgi:hypothetical protein